MTDTPIPEDIRESAKAALCEALKDDRTGTAIMMSMFGPDKQAFEQAIAKAILAERQRDQWQPIETAPKDGTDVLCICMRVAEGREQYLGTMAVDSWKDRYHGFGQFNNLYWPATHWMPLPAAPKGGEA